MDENLITAIQATGGAVGMGLVAWVLRRVFTHTIPRLASDFKDSLKQIQALFIQQQQDFREEMKESRAVFAQELHTQRSEFRDELKCEREEIGGRMDKLTQAVSTLVHEIRKK